MHVRSSYIALTAFLMLLVSSASMVSAAELRSNAQTWLANYNEASANARMVSRVHKIFDDVKSAYDSLANPSRLYIIESNTTPWATALEDGNIILTTGAIDVVYNGDGSLYQQDSRMAFVLGHELKHVIEKDFSHQRAFLALTESANSDIFSTADDQSIDRKTLELSADEEGLIHASLAGYDTSAIFSRVGGAKNFLEHWARQTNAISGNQYASPQERTDYLRDRYENIEVQLEFFRYGVRLAHFGAYDKALALLEDFSKVFESARVLANRGYVHLQLARSHMDEELAYRYWFPDLLDLDSGFPVSTSRNMVSVLPEKSRKHLETAVDLLTAGLNYSDDDLFTRMNLITAHLLLEEYSAARAVIERIENWDSIPKLLGLDAIVTLQDKRMKNPWDSYSLELVEQLANKPDAPVDLVYNFARLLQESNRSEQAHYHWTKLAMNLSALPRNYQVMVCRELDEKKKCIQEIESFSIEHHPLELALNPGDNINSKKSRKLIKSWKTEPIESFSVIGARIYPDQNGRSRLVFDDEVKLVTVGRLDSDEHRLIDKYGEPDQIIITGSEHIWSYGPHWSALVVDNKVRELWIAQ